MSCLSQEGLYLDTALLEWTGISFLQVFYLFYIHLQLTYSLVISIFTRNFHIHSQFHIHSILRVNMEIVSEYGDFTLVKYGEESGVNVYIPLKTINIYSVCRNVKNIKNIKNVKKHIKNVKSRKTKKCKMYISLLASGPLKCFGLFL